MKRDLIETMQLLYSKEINCGLESFWDGGFNVWIGLQQCIMVDDAAIFEAQDLHKAADWLLEAAKKRYPLAGL